MKYSNILILCLHWDFFQLNCIDVNQAINLHTLRQEFSNMFHQYFAIFSEYLFWQSHILDYLQFLQIDYQNSMNIA